MLSPPRIARGYAVAVASPAPAPSLADLLARPGLALRPLAGAGPRAVEAGVRWVHSSDLLDPTPFLSEGLVLLTTGRQFRAKADAPVYAEYVARLCRRGVVGLGFGTEVIRQGVPALLADACAEQGLPLFEVPYDTPFIAVARAAAEAIAAADYARQTWGLDAQRAIALAALRPDGLAASVDALGRQLGAFVALYDGGGRLVHAHGEPPAGADAGLGPEVEHAIARGARASASVAVGDTRIVVHTLGAAAHVRGALVIARADLDQAARGVVTSTLALLGLALEQRHGLGATLARLRAGLVHALRTAPDPALALRLARDVGARVPAPPVAAVVLPASAAERADIVDRLDRPDRPDGPGLHGAAPEGLVVIVPAADADAVAEGLAARHDVPVGTAIATAWGDLDAAIARAALARDAAPGATAYTDALDPLAAVLRGAEARALATAPLDALARHDTAAGTELRDTVAAWLRADASIDAAARALGVHRHTVRARLRAAEGVLGRPLDGMAVRAELWLALRAAGA